MVDGSAPNVSTVSYSFSVTACYETFYTAVDILNGNLCSTLVFFLYLYFPFCFGKCSLFLTYSDVPETSIFTFELIHIIYYYFREFDDSGE